VRAHAHASSGWQPTEAVLAPRMQQSAAMLHLPCFADAFCVDQDNTDGAASEPRDECGLFQLGGEDDSESAAAGGTPSRQKQPPLVSRVAFGASARVQLHGNVDATAQMLDAGTHVGAGTKSRGQPSEWGCAHLLRLTAPRMTRPRYCMRRGVTASCSAWARHQVAADCTFLSALLSYYTQGCMEGCVTD
jgi:hypothetical protein